MKPPPVQYVTTKDGYSIAYTVEGAGSPLVMLDVLSHRVHVRQTPAFKANNPLLTARFRVVAYDKRGTGMSRRGLLAGHTYADYLLDLEAVVEHLQLQRFILCDTTFMYKLAVAYAVAHSERVEALVLTGPVLDPRPRFEGNLILMEQDWDYYLNVLARNTTPPGGDPLPVKEYLGQTTSQADYVKWSRSFHGQPIESLLKQINLPTLVLALPQEINANTDQEGSSRVAAMIPGARLHVVRQPGDFASRIVAFADELEAGQKQPSGAPAALLSSRELEVLRLLASGKSNPEIAALLSISRNTVLRHVNHIFAKIGAVNRVEAATYAHRQGLA